MPPVPVLPLAMSLWSTSLTQYFTSEFLVFLYFSNRLHAAAFISQLLLSKTLFRKDVFENEPLVRARAPFCIRTGCAHELHQDTLALHG